LIATDLVRQAPLFAALPEAELARLAEHLVLRDFEPGALLMREGAPATRFLIVLSGEVDIIKALGTPDERLLAARGAGTVAGEMGLFNPGGTHTATVRASSTVQALEMTVADFDGLLHRQPALAYGMVQTLSLRLIEAEQSTILDLREKNQALAQAYAELAAAQAQIIEKERLERELEVARGIQSSLLPPDLPRDPAFDFGARMVPMSAVGGDFYDVTPLGPDTYAIAVGDVSDHGVPAALFMAITVTLLRAECRRPGPPADVLRRVNRQLLEVNATGMFVTLLYGTLNTASREFAYARAGHEPPLVCDAAGARVAVPRARGELLGIEDDPALDEQRVALAPGSTLLLYTDGAREATSPAGAMFGLDGLRAVVAGQGAGTAQAVCEAVLDGVSAHRGPAAQQDDITLVAVRAA
jgi:sigma-B regulation protein RsbU (phosphoserine phosphatase)